MMYATTHLLPWRITSSSGTEIQLFLWPVSQFLTTAFSWVHFALCLQKECLSFSSFLDCSSLPSPVMFHFLGWRWTSNALWLFCYVFLLHSVTSSMQPTVYEILICLLHVSRTNIFSINPSLCGAEQLVSRRVHFCLSLPWRMKRDKCGIDTLSGYKLQGNHNTVFSRYALWSGKYRKSG